MNKDEADKILLALDGVIANIETLRSLVENQVNSETPIFNSPCGHTSIREISTHGGNTTFCDDCGYQL